MQGVSLHEALLSSPVAVLKIGSQSHRSPKAAGGPAGQQSRVAKADWDFHCSFALLLPLEHHHLVVSLTLRCGSIVDVSKHHKAAGQAWVAEQDITAALCCYCPGTELIAGRCGFSTSASSSPQR